MAQAGIRSVDLLRAGAPPERQESKAVPVAEQDISRLPLQQQWFFEFAQAHLWPNDLDLDLGDTVCHIKLPPDSLSILVISLLHWKGRDLSVRSV